MAVDLQRRALLFGRGRQPQPTPLRPPWALAEAEFLLACDGCGDCLSACPEGLLDSDQQGLPLRIAEAGECTWCGDCVAACPRQALDPQSGRQLSSRARVGGDCLNVAGIVCSSCRDACPERAIGPVLGRLSAPSIDHARCTGCGACVSVCPVATISLLPLSENRA